MRRVSAERVSPIRPAWLDRGSRQRIALEKPDRPVLVREIDDECLRREAQDTTIEERRAQVRDMRMRFRQTARKGREDFETARNYRGHEQERE